MLSESDIHLLEAYLDDALSASEVQALDARLTEEPELAASLDSLRADRNTRVAVITAFTPSEQEAERFSDELVKSVRRKQWNQRWLGNIRIVAGIAACVIVGFAVGWIGRGRQTVSAQIVSKPAPQKDVAIPRVIDMPDSRPGQYHVALVDDKGNVIAIQRCDKSVDTRRFADLVAQATPGTRLTEPEPSRRIRHTEPVNPGELGTTQPKTVLPPSTRPSDSANVDTPPSR